MISFRIQDRKYAMLSVGKLDFESNWLQHTTSCYAVCLQLHGMLDSKVLIRKQVNGLPRCLSTV
jgi:hypothetical protein